ncbi:hypothetical protein LVB77_01265 [Lysobacter sp. 5GHs7-4]|uniref:hypothetical protein n=1 Tax=Lysobacter sp. 5GHs7-4 TaxID=2904253 RepID=UPI001E2B27B4|nr:hypothetical protein [Lysobacter sp. 5GHs7-4]UHQ23373.1 hypothetical protein LVB77_01265 [Lysobacter sp. 5GHs7-4]
MSASPADLPELLPFKLDLVGRRVLWLRLSAQQREEAAFLDDRAVPANAEGGWMPLASLPPAAASGARPADAIFHIGHCGSTLLSRVLGAWPEVQGLREPLPLRTLAEAWPLLGRPESRLSEPEAPELLRALWSQWSRALSPHTRSVVKATSGCNGLIAPLLERCADARAILLDMPLRPYLATLLKSPASVLDAASAAGERLCDLQARGHAAGVALHALSLPQQCAMGWLAERVRFAAHAQGAHAARVLRMDFETLLAQPEPSLQRAAAHLGLDPQGLPRALAAAAWGRYSKAQTHDYGRDDRAHDLALAMQRHADEIAQGQAWVDAIARREPALAAAIDAPDHP